MPAPLRVRDLTDEERTQIEKLARSRTASTRAVERARMILYASQGDLVPAISARLGLCGETIRIWIKRFNTSGLSGLGDTSRSGRPTTYTPDDVAQVIALSLTDPQTLDLPFACWTLDRLEAYLNEVKGIAIKRSRINELLAAEGLRWRTHETWFGERPDPEFAEKRGALSSSTPRRRRQA